MSDNQLYSGTNKAEEHRLAKESNKNKFVFDVSWSLIDPLLKRNQSLLDIGAGSNPALGLACEKKSSDYLAIDQNESMTQTLAHALSEAEAKRSKVICGDAVNTIIQKNSFAVGHMRFVLMHNTPNRKERLIRNLLTSTKTAIFVEWDWETLSGVSDLFEEVKNFLLTTSVQMGIDTSAGAKLLRDIDNALTPKERQQIKTITCQRAESFGDQQELIDLLKTIQEHSIPKGKQVTEKLIEALSNVKMTFRRPDIVSVVVSKK